MDKEIASALDDIDKINPFATYLDNNTLSRVGEWIDTGSYVLNAIISGSIKGGIPKGRVVEIYGPESSGKTTLSLHVAAEAQKAGGVAAFIDAEHALDPVYAAALGVDIDELLVSQPDTGEQALEIKAWLAQTSMTCVPS